MKAANKFEIKTEAELALKFVEHFSDFTTYKEVETKKGIIDLVIDKGIVKVGVEVKMRFGVDVIQQALNQRPYFHYLYIATPIHKSPHPLLEKILKNEGIGWLVYIQHPPNFHREFKNDKNNCQIFEAIAPSLNRKPLLPHLAQYQIENVAGCQHGRVTSFQFFINEITKDLKKKYPEGITPEELFKKHYYYYNSLKSFKNNLYQWARIGYIKNIGYRTKKFYYTKDEMIINE